MSTEQSTEPAAVSLPPRRLAILVGVALLALALDITTKSLVVANLEGKDPVTVLPGVLYFDVSRNSGAAFSMATGMTWILSLLALAIVVGLVWAAPRLRSIGWSIGLGLVLAGAFGNLIDRIFRAPGPLRGHVVDFISVFHPWGAGFAIFNVADSCITVGAVVIVLMGLLGKDYDGGVARRAKLAAEQLTTEQHATDTPDSAS
ncbi:MAG TPA: signal peptidase II [Pseudonocardiaceae bacterium]|nr:signal peptidase II [Pseudonocardiaceae bacterium]